MGRQRASEPGSEDGTTRDWTRRARAGTGPLRADGAGGNSGSSLLTAAIVAAALLAAISVVYAVAVAPASTPYTEFSLLADDDPDATLAYVPDELAAGTTIDPVVAVGNHRGAETSYTVLVVVERRAGPDADAAVTDRRVAHRLTRRVAPGEQWRRAPELTLSSPGTVDVRYLLFRGTVPADPPAADAERRLVVSTRVTAANGTAAG